MYVHIFGYLVNKLEIWWVYLSPIERAVQRAGFDPPPLKVIDAI